MYLLRSFRRKPKKNAKLRRNNSMSNDSSLMTNDESTTVDLVWRAKHELHEKPEWRERDIQALRDMVLADSKLSCRLDDAFLLRFLRARKFDYDRAFQLLQNYFAIRSENADVYENFRPSAVMHVFEQNIQTILPKRDQIGHRIFVYRAGKWDPERCSLDDIFRANQMCLEKAIEEEETQINGFVAIVDMKDFSLQHAKHLRPAYAKKVLLLIQDCFPARFKGFHFINEHTVLDMILAVVKPFLSEKIKNRIYCHGSDLNSLHEYICADVLPQDFGGPLPPIDNSDFIATLLENDDEFDKNTKYGYKTSTEVVKGIETFNGVVGHYYRKLCVD